MNEGLIGKRYARALLDFATGLGQEKALYDRMRVLSASILTVPQIREALQSPVIPTSDKRQLLYTAAGGGTVEESYSGFVRLVIKNERENLIQFIAVSYISLYRIRNRITVVILTSVNELSAAVVKRITKDVEMRTHNPVEIETRIDPSIAGGFIFQIDDLRLDASVRGQLEKIRRELTQPDRIIV